ncbi:MAG: PEP-CTERM sorting domain-containing protein [bacterium]|nr:PEP-CTERM sorting domain-containing protein [bacterium]
MKRILICALGVLMVANVASAATVELRHNGIKNDEFTMALNTSDTVQLFISFSDAPGGSGANIGDGNGFAVWISSGIQLDSLDGAKQPLPANPWVEWDSGGAGDGGVGAPGGMNINGRIGTAGTKSFADYNLIYQDAAEGAFPFPVGDGWAAAAGQVFHADNIKVDGVLETPLGSPQLIFHPGLDAQPAWDEGRSYDGINVIGFMTQDIDMVLGSKKGGTNQVRIHVTPEPASLAMLALGGLAAFRRRR